jgi:hypothetical protein
LNWQSNTQTKPLLSKIFQDQFRTMKIFATTATLLVATVATTALACDTPSFGSCGNAASGSTCCPSGQYCQPWNPYYYQCIEAPAQCPQQFTDTELYGDDLATLYGIQPADCCAKCAATEGCKAYTFINNQAGSPVCYLKKGTGVNTKNVGAVSGILGAGPAPTPSPTTAPPMVTPAPPPTGACSTPKFGKCGDNNSKPCYCPFGQYCQPWDAGYFQCVDTPPQCSKQYTNVDLYGNDIDTLYGIQPVDCCAKCAQTPGCKAYTFVNSNPGRPACYLKSAVGAQSEKIGAVSGIVN